MFKNQLKRFGSLALLSVALLVSCTDLEIKETDSIFTEAGEGFNGVADPNGALQNLDNSIRGVLENQENVYALQEVSTDEQFVPTRGTDWGDNGIWRVLHQHTWSSSHRDINNAWNEWNKFIFNATEIIDPRSNASDEVVGEAKFLRAFSMFWIMDFYGQVPFREPDEGPEVNPVVLSRAEAYARVLKDLDDAIAVLPDGGPNNNDLNRHANKASARFLKARTLLNSGVYLGTGEPSSADLDEVISLVNAIEADGYQLQEGFFEIFMDSPDSETIWWISAGVGNRMWNGLHYNQKHPDNSGGGWNGFSTLAEFYDLFEGPANSNYIGEGQEERRGYVVDLDHVTSDNWGFGYGMQIGQMYGWDFENNQAIALKDRSNNPLVFTKELPGLYGNNELTGIRTLKYSPRNGAYTGHQIIFRYADAHLMKAEAYLWKGETGMALDLVNELRELRHAQPLGSIDTSVMLDERGRELYHEFVRRTDMIRLGEFTDTWEFKDPGAVGDDTKKLYPIPSNALLSNPNLVQNPGY